MDMGPWPVSLYGLHVSANGSAFQTSNAWGAGYSNDLFTAEWGNLFGAPMGHEVVRSSSPESGIERLPSSLPPR